MHLPAAFLPTLAALTLAVTGPSPGGPVLPCSLTVTPEIKLAFHQHDAIEIRTVTGTTKKFQVGGTYRVTGTCCQQSLRRAVLYVGNTAEAGDEAIIPLAGSSLSRALPDGSTEFDCTFTLRRPGILHVTIYDLDNHHPTDNAYEGIYLGDACSRIEGGSRAESSTKHQRE